ncbi:MAG TPA: helix-turn-helix domain-containing GNAT family N-acetyltransferase [Rhizomicrobium sp.]|jgi:DNA-binding MarR family transcriptional regulator/predicted GNAT family acetyltransferase|nr:helix-turn-helix domain-containing GNAT family N-acetyltransferase [Rhizomicrobium sp.]
MSETGRRAHEIRAFNRFYTRKIGVLTEDLLDSPFSLAEARVLYELAQREQATALVLRDVTGLDQGYLSRILARFEREGLLVKKKVAGDGRARSLHLTGKGRTIFARLDQRAQNAVIALLDVLSEKDQRDIVDHMQALSCLLEPCPQTQPVTLLRPPRAGDLGWVIQRQAILYAQEYGWDASYETLIADIVGKFRAGPGEACWIAELDGAPAGAILVVREDDKVARLRLLHVEPFARGRGLGRLLVDTVIAFARDQGYDLLKLWTNDVLVSARRIYQAAGFALTREEKHHSFGKDLVGQTWELKL